MNNKQITRPIAIWLAFPNGETGTLSGVLSYSSQTQGVRFHSYTELMELLRRVATVTDVENETSALMLRLAS